MSNKIYLCTLKPISKFFFGGERTFGDEEETKTNYLVHSNAFPQQTTILGMLRFELLKQNKPTLLLPISSANEADVITTIGKESFKIAEIGQTFGYIEKISPLFICKRDEILRFAPRDNVRYTNKKGELVVNEQLEFTNNSTSKAFLFGMDKTLELPVIEKFNHKHQYQPHFIATDGNSIPFKYDKETKEGIFISDSQIGIKKGENKKDSKGFYKQFYYRMNKEFTFGFYLETSQSITEQQSIVFMGADKSAFVLTISDANTATFEDSFGVDETKVVF